jgi:DNA-binding NtrC family response regulator
LQHYAWPGNVRELRSAMETAVVLSRGDKVGVRDLPSELRDGMTASAANGSSQKASAPVTVQEAEKQLIIRALKENDGNRTLAASKIGMSRRTLHRKLRLYHIEGL